MYVVLKYLQSYLPHDTLLQVTRLVHGEDGLKQALRVTSVLFGKGSVAELSQAELVEVWLHYN